LIIPICDGGDDDDGDVVVVVGAGTGKGYSVLDMVSAMKKASGREIPYVVGERRAGDLDVVYSDPSKVRQIRRRRRRNRSSFSSFHTYKRGYDLVVCGW